MIGNSMSTILTINTKEHKTRVTFSQPLCSISEIQLVDYDFPETYEVFKTDQEIKTHDGSKTLLTISKGGYSYKMLRTVFNMSNFGLVIHPVDKGYCIISKYNNAVVSRELAKTLDIPSLLFSSKYYPISWPSYKYHVYCYISTFSSVLGQITTTTDKGLKLLPTNLLAVIPSKSEIYPSCQIWLVSHPINYITLLVLNENGNEPKFGGMPFRINLKIIY